MKSFLLALQFLTTFPVRKDISFESDDFARSLRWFPAIGFLIGLVQWSLAFLLREAHVSWPWASLLILITNLLVTGGLHLDGVADSIDGFAAGRDRESVLRIMKDTRLGVFAMAGIFVTLYAKIHSMELVIRTDHFVALLTAPIISRTMLVLSCTVLPYAREGGTGKAFGISRWTIHLLPAIAICVLGVFLLDGMRGLLVLAQAAAISALFSLYCYKKIGGYTGDTLGFLNELIEISCLLATGLFF